MTTERQQANTRAVALAFGVIAVGFILDVLTGRDLSVFIVYALGVSLAARRGGVRPGFIGAVASALAVSIDGFVNGVHPLVATWNALTALVILGALVLAVDRLSNIGHRDRTMSILERLEERRAGAKRARSERRDSHL